MKLCVLLIALAAATPSTAIAIEPSTRPVNSTEDDLTHAQIDLKDKSERMVAAEAKRKEAEANARARIDAKPDVAKLKSAMAEAQEKYQALRKQHLDELQKQTSDELRKRELTKARSDLGAAGAKYDVACEAYYKAVEEKVVRDPDLRLAEKERTEAWTALCKAKAAELDLRSTREAHERDLSLAIRSHWVVVGMTESQTEQSMGIAGSAVSETSGEKTVKWNPVLAPANVNPTTTYARFVSGKVVKVWSEQQKR